MDNNQNNQFDFPNAGRSRRKDAGLDASFPQKAPLPEELQHKVKPAQPAQTSGAQTRPAQPQQAAQAQQIQQPQAQRLSQQPRPTQAGQQPAQQRAAQQGQQPRVGQNPHRPDREAAKKSPRIETITREKIEARAQRATKNSAQMEKTKKIRRIIILAVAEIIALVAIFGYAYALKQYNKIQRPEVDVEAVKNKNLSIENIKKMETGYWNIAAFGVDSRDSSVGKGANSDVIMVISVNRQTGDIKLVSVFRDTYLKTDDNTYNKINAAYCMGGPEQALKAINENLDLNITDYVTFNWKAVATAIGILGGVDIELSNAEFYYMNSYITSTVEGTDIASVQLSHAGMNHLDGVQAVAYARLRYMDNDYSRTERQRKVISLCFDKIKQCDYKTLDMLLGTMLSMVATNLTWQDGYDAIANLTKYNIAETGGFPFARGEAVVGKRGSCVIPQTLESNVKELHRFLFDEEDYEPSDAVKAIGAKISADSGMYNEGEVVGHVSTAGAIIPNVPGAPKTETKSAENNETAETNEEGETVETETVVENGVEYAISRDGYLICVDGFDSDGNKKYKYVLDDDDKRIKMIERDAEGNLVYLYEIDENGNFTFDTEGTTIKPTAATTEESPVAETDADGNPIESTSANSNGPGGGEAPTEATSGPSTPGGTTKPTEATGQGPNSESTSPSPTAPSTTAAPRETSSPSPTAPSTQAPTQAPTQAETTAPAPTARYIPDSPVQTEATTSLGPTLMP